MKSRSTLKRATLVSALAVGFLAAAPQSSNAVNLYWDNGAAETNPLWATLANWDTQVDGLGGNPGAVPGASDIAIFNTSPLNTAQTIYMDANHAVDGLIFNSTGDVSIHSITTQRLLTIGASGITKTSTSAGITTFGTAASAGTVPAPGVRNIIGLSASQTWTNDAVDPLSIFNFVTSAPSTTIAPSVAAPVTLTLTGTNTGLNRLDKTLTNGSGTLSVVKNGPGTWIYGGGGSSNATYTGGFTLNEGIFAMGATTNSGGIGNGTVTLNGGELTGYVSNVTTVFNTVPTVNVTGNSTIRATRLDKTAGVNFTILATNFTTANHATPGSGPTLTFGRGSATVPQILNISGTSTINQFNGTLKFELATASAAMTYAPTTANGYNGANAKFVFDTPAGSTVGSARFDMMNQGDPTLVFKMGELSGSGLLSFRGGGLTSPYSLEVGNLGTDSTFTGAIRNFGAATNGTLGLKKVGIGSLTLSGESDYTAGTFISNGTIVVGADAVVPLFQPSNPATQNIALVASTGVFTSRDSVAAPTNHNLVDGQRVSSFRGFAAADYVNVANKPLYVKVLSPTTFQLYTDQALTTSQVFTTDIAANLTLSMSGALGAGTTAVQLGDGGASTNNVSLLAGTATAPSVNIGRAVNVAANAGGTSTIGSTVDGNSVFSGAITLGKNVNITSASAGANTLTVSGVVSGTGFGINKVGAGNATLTAANTYTGNTTVSGGFLTVANGGSITTPTTGNLSVGDGVFRLAGTASVQNTANTAGTGTIHVQSTGNLTSNNLFADFATIDGTTTIRQNGGTAGASKVETFNIGAGGKLNLKDNDLVVGTAPNFNAVRTAIIAGKTNNAATGITSDITGFGISRGFGYAMGNDPKVSSLLAGSLAGQTFDTDSVLVKFTLLGDADLDGDTDLNDLGLWSNGYTGDLGANPPAPTTFWTGGDFDYDGDTDLNDLGLWSSTYTGDFNGGPGSLVVNAPNASPEAVAILNSMGFTVVPEPSTFVLAGVGLAGLAIAARRKRSA